MAYVIAQPCVGVKDKACLDVCPVDCIHEGPDQLFIHAEDCIDCDACRPVCPVDAIYTAETLPAQWRDSVARADRFFAR